MGKAFVFIIIISVFIFLYKKEIIAQNALPTTNPDTCILPADTFRLGSQWFQRILPRDFHAPCFNPKNANQFVYLEYDYQNKCTIIKMYDLSTKSGKALTEVGSSSNPPDCQQPRWSAKDWIVFENGVDQQLWKIKASGDSLKQITYEGAHNSFPTWSKDGTKIIFSRLTNNSNFSKSILLFLVADENGVVIDSINPQFGYFQGDWSASNQIVTSAGYWSPNILVINNFKSITQLTFFPLNPSLNEVLYCMTWMPDNINVVYSCGSGVFKLNAVSKTITRLRQGCLAKNYEYVSVSPDGKKIIAEIRYEYPLAINGATGEESHIVIMNSDGTDEVTIF